jgi:hypothetical protein
MTDETHWSKSDWERWLQETPGWWHDPKWGVAKGKTFRRWAISQWRAAKQRRSRRWGHCPARHYNIARKALRLRQGIV